MMPQKSRQGDFLKVTLEVKDELSESTQSKKPKYNWGALAAQPTLPLPLRTGNKLPANLPWTSALQAAQEQKSDGRLE